MSGAASDIETSYEKRLATAMLLSAKSADLEMTRRPSSYNTAPMAIARHRLLSLADVANAGVKQAKTALAYGCTLLL